MSTAENRELKADLLRMEKRLDNVRDYGCGKAVDHKELERKLEKVEERLRLLELAHAEGKGKLAVIMVLIGIAVSVATQWLNKRL